MLVLSKNILIKILVLSKWYFLKTRILIRIFVLILRKPILDKNNILTILTRITVLILSN